MVEVVAGTPPPLLEAARDLLRFRRAAEVDPRLTFTPTP